MRIDLTFAHDDQDRLVEVAGAGGRVRYRYDAAGNRVAVEAEPEPEPGAPANAACGQCGQTAAADDRFCRRCGAARA